MRAVASGVREKKKTRAQGVLFGKSTIERECRMHTPRKRGTCPEVLALRPAGLVRPRSPQTHAPRPTSAKGGTV